MPAGQTTESDAASTKAGSEPAMVEEQGGGSRHPLFSTLPEAPAPSVSSHVRKAQVRAALFRKKVEPVRVGRFILLERLGAGAMGEIYAAYDEQLDRRVALKLVRHGSELSRSDELLLREAQALAQVSHPNVVQIYEAGSHDGRLFIAMELIRGQTLTRWLGDVARLPRPQRQREILRSFIAAGRGLEAAHAAGVAHRDFKPDNVLVGDDGRVRVVDFGLARAVIDVRSAGEVAGGGQTITPDFAHGQTVRMEAEALSAGGSPSQPRLGRIGEPETVPASRPPKLTAARLTETGLVMGTPRFMAPEQIRGAIADHRSDQFSFCVALYHALYGAWPFSGERLQDLLNSIESRVLGSEHSAGVSAGVRNALRRGLSVDPSQRFASMGELLAALEPGLRRRREWVAGAVLVFFAFALLVHLRQEATDPCASAGDGIDAMWSVPQQGALQVAFAGTNLPYADTAWRGTKQRIDGYANGWRSEAIAACRVTHVDHVQSEQLLDRRMLCLERGRQQVGALVSELSRGVPETVQRAVEAAESLPDLHACSNTENMMYGLEPPPAAIARDIATVREQLARAFTLEQMGRAEESLALSRHARAITERLPYRPVHAEVLVQIARAVESRGTKEARTEAEALYFEALDIAEAERHEELAAVIWTQLVRLATRMDASMQQAHAWWRRNDAAVRRAGNSVRDRARIHHLLGEIYFRDGKFAEAADQQNRAIATLAGVSEQQTQLSRYYGALAKALEPLDRLDEALRLHERTLAIAVEALGSSHPNVIALQMNYARALAKQGQLDRARTLLEATLANMPASYRESHLDAGKLHTLLSDVSYRAGKLDDAIMHARTSLQVYERAKAPDTRLAEAYVALGNLESLRKNYREALAHYERALALRRPHLRPDHFQIGANEGLVAEALAGLGRYDEARARLDRAVPILDHSVSDREIRAWIYTLHGEVLVGQRQLRNAIPVLEQALPMQDGLADQSNTPRAMWALARALHALGKDPIRVRKLAEDASARFATLGPHEARNRDTVERFLERLPTGPASRSP
jgi:eukaryotic-like serine/threonine-protein kinase